MPVTFLSRFKIKPETDAEFMGLIREMEAVAATEADTLQYKFYRLDDAGGFAVFESFTSEEADFAHQSNPASQHIIAKMIDCIDGTYLREYLYPVER